MATEYFARRLRKEMGPLRSRTAKQVYEYTVKTFNGLLGYIQEERELSKKQKTHLGQRLHRLYQVWDVWATKRKGSVEVSWWNAYKWLNRSGLLGQLKPLFRVNESTWGEKLWEIVTSEDFLRWMYEELQKA